MADRCDIAVIGGGVMGLALAVHLLEAGAGDVRLVERDTVGEGTTAAGGGFLGDWAPYEQESAAARYGRAFYARLQEEGDDIGYRSDGMMYVAAGEAVWQELIAWQTGTPLSAAEVERVTDGAVPADNVRGGVLISDGGQVHAPKVATALAKRFRAGGGRLDTRRPVTAISTAKGRVRAVETTAGPITCGAVVVAAGAWSGALTRDLGFFLPAAPQVTSRVSTEPLDIPGTLPLLFLTGLTSDEPGGGTLLWVREHEGGLLWGGTYATFPRDVLIDAPVPDRLDELPIDGVLEILRIAGLGALVMPALARRSRLRIKHGAPCHTPDSRALIGPVPGVEGVYVLAGDNEAGITYGPGYGKALADHITRGTPLDQWRPDRFGDRFTTQRQVVDALKAAEAASVPPA
ncbi:FAD-binding oxidoreductase [Herbidospora galbida]|uniref:FAD-binding oxidoreductase n=1 Tax=Herbidospora galbida TaxID=2575442 RepID=A0A4U3MP93_9ACTN|nr:FAD-binding oxidoreductase [Herbidospora galbida]TKK91425.1 FAD-binding oxidoreductase [Herbidospora galbida]